jgi:hypothetical protein
VLAGGVLPLSCLRNTIASNWFTPFTPDISSGQGHAAEHDEKATIAARSCEDRITAKVFWWDFNQEER